MQRLLSEQLSGRLSNQAKVIHNRPLHRCYLLCGHDPLLQQESQRAIRQAAVTQGFTDYYHFSIDANTDWQTVHANCDTYTLFGHRKILQLTMGSPAPSSAQAQKLMTLATHLNDSICLILALPQLKKSQEQTPWFQAFAHLALYVACHPPTTSQLPEWIRRRAKSLGLNLDGAVIARLCFHYEGNLPALVQLLESLTVRYPIGQLLTLPQLVSALQNVSCFTPKQWLEALLFGEAQRAVHILRRLQVADTEPLLLLRTLQTDLLLLFELKRHATVTPSPTLPGHQASWRSRQKPFMRARQRLSYTQLRQALYRLTQLECCLKCQGGSAWEELEILSLLLCGVAIPTNILYDE